MKGFPVQEGYFGFINGEYVLFATEQDYVEYYKSTQTNQNYK